MWGTTGQLRYAVVSRLLGEDTESLDKDKLFSSGSHSPICELGMIIHVRQPSTAQGPCLTPDCLCSTLASDISAEKQEGLVPTLVKSHDCFARTSQSPV